MNKLIMSPNKLRVPLLLLFLFAHASSFAANVEYKNPAQPSIGHLEKIRTVEQLRDSLRISVKGRLADHLQKELKPYDDEPIFLRPNGTAMVSVQLRTTVTAVKFLTDGTGFEVNGKRVDIDWNGDPAIELEKLKDAFPKLSGLNLPLLLNVPSLRLMTSLVGIESAEAALPLYLIVIGAVSAVGAVGQAVYKCHDIEATFKACEKHEGLESAKPEASPETERLLTENFTRYSSKLNDPGFLCSKIEPLKQCLTRRGYDVNVIKLDPSKGSIRKEQPGATSR